MFDAVRKFQTPAKILLGLIALSLVGFAANSYDGMGSSYIVKVGDQEITHNSLKQELEKSQTPANDETRQTMLDRLVEQAYLSEGMKKMGLAISVEQVKAVILAEATFQENGTFSKKKYETYLKNQNVSEEALVQNLQEQFSLQSLINTIQAGSIFSDTQINQVVSLFAATHIVRSVVINPADYVKKMTVTDEVLQKFYQEHQANYLIPAAAKIEYIKLSAAQLANKQRVSDEEAKQYFDSNQKQYAKPERDVAHILLKFPDGADAAEKEKIKVKAAKVLAEVKANPNEFAKLAQKYSQDTLSAQNGGNLGFFAQDGLMVKPFEEAAFTLKPGEISDLVETQFGYHILKVIAVKDAPKFAEVKDEVIAQLKQQKAAKLFNLEVGKLKDSVFANVKELNTTAKQLGLAVEQDDQWISKEIAAQAKLPEKLVMAIFSDDVFKNKHNSEVIDLGEQTVMVVRVKETRAARTIGFAEAKPSVEKAFIAQEALKLAQEDAKAQLVKLRKGEPVNLNWDKEPTTLTSEVAGNTMPIDVYKEMLALKVSKEKPGFVLVSLENAPPVLLKIEDVVIPKHDEQMAAAIKGQLQQLQVNSVISGYVQVLKQKIKQKMGQQKLIETEK